MHFAITSFSGVVPKIAPEKLPTGAAQEASDCTLDSGNLEAAAQDLAVKSIGGGVRTIHKYDDAGTDVWITSTDELDIVKGPVAADEKNRILITGIDEYLRVTDSDNIAADGTITTAHKAGLPAGTAPSYTSSGGSSSSTEATAYVYTYVREWGDGKVDEGPPSAASAVASPKVDDTNAITGIATPPSGYGITNVYIYRSQTDSEGVATFRWVGEVTAGTNTFNDDMSDTPGETLPSDTWIAPPDDLTGIIGLPNGCIAGFVGNEVIVSEPFVTHGYPVSNRQVTEHNIVGLGSFGTYIAVLTEGYPILINAEDPAAMAVTAIESRFPCLSKQGIVSTDSAVFYPSASGLVKLDTTGAALITQGLFGKDNWQNLGPESFNAALYNEKYLAFYSKTFPANTLESSEVTVEKGILINLDADGLYAVNLSVHGEAIFTDPESDTLYYSVDGSEPYIYQYAGNIWGRKSYSWRSKEFISKGGKVNMSNARVLSSLTDPTLSLEEIYQQQLLAQGFAMTYDEAASSSVAEAPLGGFPINSYPLGGDILTSVIAAYNTQASVIFNLYADGELKFSKRIASDKPFKLPSGYKANRYSVELTGNVPVYRVDVATTSKELPSG